MAENEILVLTSFEFDVVTARKLNAAAKAFNFICGDNSDNDKKVDEYNIYIKDMQQQRR